MGNEAEEPRQAVDLASEPSRRVGPLIFDPATRSIAHEDGRAATLEPRIAKLLAALLREPGRVFSRDDLFESCWEGRAVGDDAVDQAVARLRRALLPVAGAFIRIETVTKVGHRLILAVPDQNASPEPARPRRWARLPLIAAAGAAMLILAIAAVMLLRPGQPRAPRVAILAQHGSGAEALARSLSGDLARLAGVRPDALSVTEAWQQADHLIRVSRHATAGSVRAELNLIARGSPELLWSRQFQRPAREEADLRQQVAAKLGDLIICMHDAGSATARLGATGWRLFLTACDQLDEPAGEPRRNVLRRLTREAPDFAWSWAMLGYVEASMTFRRDVTQQRRGDASNHSLVEAARDNMVRARALDPSIGEIYAIEESLILEPGRWRDRIAVTERGLAVDPDNPALLQVRGAVLAETGQNSAAIANARRIVELRPDSAALRSRLIIALAYRGNVAGAWRELEEAERIWPGLAVLRDARFRIDMRYGDAARALRIIEQDETRGVPGDRSLPLERAFLRARLEPSPANIAQALRPFESFLRRERILPPGYVQALVQFGRVDDAYALFARDADLAVMVQASDVFFRPHMREFRNDPRFMALMARIGLLQYWQVTGRWPDFCMDVDLPYDCRQEARRLAGGNRAS